MSIAEDLYDIDLSDEEVARLFAWLRVGLGTLLFVAPRRAQRLWTGRATGDIAATLAVRGLGGRDAALGLGLLFALEKGTPVRGWLEAGAMADASDTIAALGGFSELPWARRLGFLAGAAAATWLGVALASSDELT